MTSPTALTEAQKAQQAKVEQEDAERVLMNAEADKYEQLKAEAFLEPEDAAAQVNAERDPALPAKFAMKCALALREQVLFDAAPNNETARARIVADRLDRWTAWLETMGGSTEDKAKLALWADAMAKRYKSPSCAMHGIVMPWLMALLVLQYGESEYFWPEAWSAQDVERAAKWASGLKPATPSKGFAPVEVEG